MNDDLTGDTEEALRQRVRGAAHEAAPTSATSERRAADELRDALRGEVERLGRENAQLERQVEQLLRRVADLEARAGGGRE